VLAIVVRVNHNNQHVSVLLGGSRKAYSLYASENVDNYERPLSLSRHFCV